MTAGETAPFYDPSRITRDGWNLDANGGMIAVATDTKVRIRRNPYSDYEVWIQANGELTRRTFSNAFDLSTKLVGECVDERVIEEACDQFERLEWEEPYPLFAPADAVCDCGEPDADPVEPADRHRELIESLRGRNAKLMWDLETCKSLLGVSFMVIAGLTFWLGGMLWGRG